MWPIQSAYYLAVLLYYRLDVLFLGVGLFLMAVLFMANMAAVAHTTQRNTERRRAARLWVDGNGARNPLDDEPPVGLVNKRRMWQ